MATLDYKSSLGRYRKYLAVATEQPMVRASLFLILSLILLIGLLLFALKPTLVTISTLLGQITTQREIVAKLDQKIVEISQSQQVWTQNQSKLFLLDQALPTKPSLQEFDKALEEQASASGIKLSGITFVKVPFSGKNADNIEFSLVAGGKYQEIRGFVEILESLRRLTHLDSVIIASDDKNNNLTLNVKGIISIIP